MKYCSKCGNEVDDEAVICPKCGCAIGDNKVAATGKNDAPSFGFALLGFLIPIVGLILYLIWKNDTPLKAKSAGKGALIGVIVSVAGSILAWVAAAGCTACMVSQIPKAM